MIIFFEDDKLVNIEANMGLTWSPVMVKNAYPPKMRVITVPEEI